MGDPKFQQLLADANEATGTWGRELQMVSARDGAGYTIYIYIPIYIYIYVLPYIYTLMYLGLHGIYKCLYGDLYLHILY
jgi:hypothetical protein